MAKLKIDGMDLMLCVDNMGGEFDYFMDLDTGKTIMVFGNEVDGEEVEDVDPLIAALKQVKEAL